jgi:hypothetical protein
MDLDAFIVEYNTARPASGLRWCYGEGCRRVSIARAREGEADCLAREHAGLTRQIVLELAHWSGLSMLV